MTCIAARARWIAVSRPATAQEARRSKPCATPTWSSASSCALDSSRGPARSIHHAATSGSCNAVNRVTSATDGVIAATSSPESAPPV